MSSELSLKRNKTTSEKILLRDEDRYIKRANLDFANAPDMQRKRNRVRPF